MKNQNFVQVDLLNGALDYTLIWQVYSGSYNEVIYGRIFLNAY